MLFQTNLSPLIDPDFSSNMLDSVFKTGFVIGTILYFVFAILVLRQIKIMKHTLITSVSPLIQILGIIHFIVALVVMIGFILFL